jgi:hypothetical protein
MLTGAVLLNVAKAIVTVWIEGLLYKLMILKLPSYLVQTISSYLLGRRFEASFQTATSSCYGMQTGVAQGGLISPVHLVWRNAKNFSKSNTIIFARAGRRFIKPRPVKLRRESILWVDTTHYLGLTVDTCLTWSPHIDLIRKKCPKDGHAGSPPEQEM